MTKHNDRIKLRGGAALVAVLMGVMVLALSGRSVAPALARGLSRTLTVTAAVAECEGDACAEVSVTFDEARQQYRAQNNSADRWARVTASNMASSASACLAPGREAYLPLKSISGGYHAAYAEVRCGEAEATGPPAGE